MSLWGLAAMLACTGETGDSGDTSGLDDTDKTAIRPDVDPATLPAGASPCREPVLAFVDHVVDGDTVYLTPDGGSDQEKVRFTGIDTPELGWEDEPDDCYGPEATAECVRLVEDRWVWLTFDQECEDQYGRTLAYVHLGGAEDDFVNRRLVREGYAWAYAVDPNLSFETELQQDEIAASQSGAGLWSACAR